MVDVSGKAGPKLACRFLIGRLLDPPLKGWDKALLKDHCSPTSEVRGLSLRCRVYHVEDEWVAATEPKSELEPEERGKC